MVTEIRETGSHHARGTIETLTLASGNTDHTAHIVRARCKQVAQDTDVLTILKILFTNYLHGASSASHNSQVENFLGNSLRLCIFLPRRRLPLTSTTT
jgi:hypothetical protein